MEIKLKRIYEEPEETDGYRILVDRLWPRGIKKEKAKIDLWAKDIAPSNELRKWFAHDAAKWDAFTKRYKGELNANPEFRNLVSQISSKPVVTILFAAKDTEHNNAVVVRSMLKH